MSYTRRAPLITTPTPMTKSPSQLRQPPVLSLPPRLAHSANTKPLLSSSPFPSNDSSTTADLHVTASSETCQISYNSIIFFVCAGTRAPHWDTIGSAMSADLSDGDGGDGDDSR
ncbi:hypothetical protein E2C01_040102 [Portunus trituberculatus]|uniref:Uncharacterized protein n=1 Tax=Portunus trituberculatus TaxID=210409 RepID=A0A5B7FGH3_PORTR|nr:hypothetical protein [Portunus trituberculatus]